MKIRNLLLVMVLVFSANSIFAQEKDEVKKENKSVFCLDGEFRNRFEYSPSVAGRTTIVPVETMSSMSFWQRSRIIANYKNDKLETKFSVQDVRSFVANDLGYKSNNGSALSVAEAWAKYYIVNNESRKLGVKIGRQELLNPDGRLIWNKDWDHYGAAYDALALEYENKDLDLKWNLAISLNSSELPGTAVKYRTLGLLNISKNFGEKFTLNFTDLMEGYDEATGATTANYVKNTVGINPVVKIADLTFNGSFYYQNGTPNVFIGSNPDPVKYAAMMYTANLSYKVGNFNAGVGYDNYSGEAYDDDQSDFKNKVFSAPYMGTHKFFGNTDIHSVLLGKGRGLQDINVVLNADFDKKTNLHLGFHMISYANENVYTDITSADQVVFTAIGNDIDLVLKRVIGKQMAVFVGYSAFLPSEEYVNSLSWGQTLDAKFHGWGWLMFSFKPNFLKFEN